jgi:hypothetical protein
MYDCRRCELKPHCTTANARKVSRDIDEDVRDHVRALANTEAFQQSRRERKKVEMRFAHMKRILRLDRLRLRGLSGVRDEVLLTATAQNLRRAAKLVCRAVTTGAGLSQAYLGGALLATSLCPLPAMNFLFLSSQEITQITDQHQLAFSWQRVQRGAYVGDAVSKPSHVGQLSNRGSHWFDKSTGS